VTLVRKKASCPELHTKRAAPQDPTFLSPALPCGIREWAGDEVKPEPYREGGKGIETKRDQGGKGRQRKRSWGRRDRERIG
jgi:hypothetical protein